MAASKKVKVKSKKFTVGSAKDYFDSSLFTTSQFTV